VETIDETLSPVYETVRRLSSSLPDDTALIGFAGAPWTVATYMAAGRGTPDQAPARAWLFRDPEGFEGLMERITEATVHYLGRQIEAGAEAVMLFDSWAGSLIPPLFERHVIEPADAIARTLGERYPNVPMIGFPKGAGAMYAAYAGEASVAAVAADQHVPLGWLRTATRGKPIMGNLDPLLMTIGGEVLAAEARRIVAEMRGYPHVFNLGHGITPDADPRHVETLLAAIRG
jgi:uroporphyrinogen decarboxylase